MTDCVSHVYICHYEHIKLLKFLTAIDEIKFLKWFVNLRMMRMGRQ